MSPDPLPATADLDGILLPKCDKRAESTSLVSRFGFNNGGEFVIRFSEVSAIKMGRETAVKIALKVLSRWSIFSPEDVFFGWEGNTFHIRSRAPDGQVFVLAELPDAVARKLAAAVDARQPLATIEPIAVETTPGVDLPDPDPEFPVPPAITAPGDAP